MSDLNYQCVSPELLEIIKKISGNKYFSQFRLCGGTALALQVGHRISVDADFVSEKNFNTGDLIAEIGKQFTNVSDVNTGTHGVFMKINNTKVDFLTWNIPFIHPSVMVDGIAMVRREEIIAMILFAILQRGEKKDYMDIASILDHFNLEQMISFYSERHIGSDSLNILKYLSSTADIENQPEPIMMNGLTWITWKKKINDAVQEIISKP